MLGEGFLRVLLYREERKFASATKRCKTQTHTRCVDRLDGVPSGSNSGPHTLSTEPGPNKEELGPSSQSPGLNAASQAVLGVSIPGCSPVVTLHPDFSVGSNTCSLLQHYPDLRLGQETGELGGPDSPLRSTVYVHGSTQGPIAEVPHHSEHVGHQGPQGELGSSASDQGYLVMGASVTTSLDLPGSGLEPMTNSLLNGLLEKQLDQVYLQHLTDSLARCNSHLGNSLLHSLVPPPQPSSHQQQGPDSLEAGLEEGTARGGGDKDISYLSTQNIAPCSSHFSSPVLRISEADNA